MIPKHTLIIIFLIFITQSKIIAQKYDAEVVNYRSLREMKNYGVVETDSITIQINDRVGDKYTKIEVEYSKIEKLENLSAWIENMDGKIVRRLKNTEIIDRSAISEISMYEDNFEKCFELRHNEYPYKLTYTFKKSYPNYLFIAHWSPVIYNTLPTRKASLNVFLPLDYKYKIFDREIANPNIDSTKGYIDIKYSATYNTPVKDENYSQPENYMPLVLIAPTYFYYGVDGCTKDWVSFGNWQYQLNEGLDVLPQNEKNTISSLIKGITDKKEIVKVLYHYLQDNTRYINVLFGIGGYKPYPASYVSDNKYGDCKALTNYMKAMLAYVGIESFYTKVYAGDQPTDLIKNFAEQQFNHAILAVPINNDTIWLENTSNIKPFGYMGAFTQNRYALLISKDQSKLVRIPALKMDDNLVAAKYYFNLELNGKTHAVVNFEIRGAGFDAFNSINNDYNENSKDWIIRKYILDECEVVDWKFKKFNRDSARIDLHANLNYPNLLNRLGDEFYFGFRSVDIPILTSPANRTLPLIFPYPISKIDTLVYKLPTGYELKSKADSVNLNSEFGNFKLKVDILDNKVIVIKKMELSSGNYSQTRYTKLYKFIKKVEELDSRQLIIKPVK